jgi:hypothetical protein
VEPIIQEKYDINSVWKVVDLARRCTENTTYRRPTMSDLCIGKSAFGNVNGRIMYWKNR